MMQPPARGAASCHLAVILAAGRGLRLAPPSLPKGLLRVGDMPLLALSLTALAAAGIREAIIVTGHKADLVEAQLGARHAGIRLRYVRNRHYASTGSLASLLCAATAVRNRDFLLLESDLLYHPRFAQIAATATGDVMLGADLTGSGDEVFLVAGSGGRLRFLGKRPSPALRRQSRAELAGISRISARLYEALLHSARQRPSAERHYEEGLFDLTPKGPALRLVHCRGLPWAEIDTRADLIRARRTVWPAIVAQFQGARHRLLNSAASCPRVTA